MALGDTYATETELRAYAKLTTAPQSVVLDALKTASRGIEGVCHRQFNKADTATARRYHLGSLGIEVDDFYTTEGLVVETDSNRDGLWATTLVANDYELYPLNGVVNGQEGWPYEEIRAAYLFNYTSWVPRHDYLDRYRARVTAKWGWNAVPTEVKTACMIVAHEMVKAGDTPFGVAGIGGDLGVLRVRENPMAMQKLLPYIKDPVLVA